MREHRPMSRAIAPQDFGKPKPVCRAIFRRVTPDFSILTGLQPEYEIRGSGL
jgi:hypothetical protein